MAIISLYFHFVVIVVVAVVVVVVVAVVWLSQLLLPLPPFYKPSRCISGV